MFVNKQQILFSAFTATTLFATSTSAAAVQPRQGDIPVNDWITIDSNGHARTITPSVVTSNGVLATISPPPYSLTGSVYTVTATTGGLTTITWDTTFFADPATPIVIVGFDVDNGITDTAPAFSVTNLSGGDGWVPWTPRVNDLEERDSNNMTIILIYSDPDTGAEMNKTGPVFTLRAALDTDPSTSRPNLLAILLPVIFISLAIAAVMLWLYIRRRKRHAAAVAAAERQNAAYATGQTRGMHGQKGSADIQLGPTSPPPGESPGRNVFQDEVRRQERERK
ncbi:hypothetical protein CSPAE12_03819 [Colletotrichum incanum]|nr:hypothetical protein CSPAE12_03819 [Colletotrichum incanum]